MKTSQNMQKLRQLCSNSWEFSRKVLEWIAQENLWGLWVPKSHGGLEMPLAEGLKKLRCLAQVDGSLGWTVTLCSGANFFMGNLQREVADEIFIEPEKPVCLGGSGGVFGTAERKGDGYVIFGKWKYATGAPYLTHFTLNARIQEGGKEVLGEDGAPMVRSFVLDRGDVKIIEDWNTMGLTATATHSFEVQSKWVHRKYSFTYYETYQPHSIFKVPFTVFADLTLWVNYIGMAAHFLEEAWELHRSNDTLSDLMVEIGKADSMVMNFAEYIQKIVDSGNELPKSLLDEIHGNASGSVRSLSKGIVTAYPMLGIEASRKGHPLNQVFRDYFTATQHHIFRAC